MWKFQTTSLPNQTSQYKITQQDQLITVADFISLLQVSTEFIDFYVEGLKMSPYEGYFWEVPPMTEKQLHKSFEFVLVNSPSLPRVKPSKLAFQQYFDKDKLVVDFPNLSGDAHLVVPTPRGEDQVYTHLANFVRLASEDQIFAFWQAVGKAYKIAMDSNSKWLSTAGLGVYWLHVRIDTRPKYYRHQLYKEFKLRAT